MDTTGTHRKIVVKKGGTGAFPQVAAQQAAPDSETPGTPVPETPAAREAAPVTTGSKKFRLKPPKGGEVRPVGETQAAGSEVSTLEEIRKRRSRVKEKSNFPVLVGLTFLFIILGLASGVFIILARGDTIGRLGGVFGTLRVAGEKGELAITPRMRIVAGYTLMSAGTNAKSFLVFRDDGVMQLIDDTEVKVDVVKMGTFQRGGRTVALQGGTAMFSIPIQPPGKAMTVYTHDATFTIASGDFALTSSSNATELIVTKGSVRVVRNSSLEALDVGKGYCVTIAENVPFVTREVTGDTQIVDVSFVDGTDAVVDGLGGLRYSVAISLERMPACFGLTAKTDPPTVGSVEFVIEGQKPIVVNEPPYTFKGREDAGVGEGWRPTPGDYKLTVTSYSKPNARGIPSAPRIISIAVKR